MNDLDRSLWTGWWRTDKRNSKNWHNNGRSDCRWAYTFVPASCRKADNHKQRFSAVWDSRTTL